MKHLFILFALAYIPSLFSMENETGEYFYRYRVSLSAMRDDKLTVELSDIPELKGDSVFFCFPVIVPGIYGEMNWGQYIDNLVAFDSSGGLIATEKVNINTWHIKEGGQLKKIIYQVNDGWENYDSAEPAGFYKSSHSSFHKDFVILNNNTVFGYFENFLHRSFRIEITKPLDFYGATSLNRIELNDTADIFFARSYPELVDNPVLYCKKDIEKLKWDDIEVTVACYSSSGKKIARLIADHIKPLLENQRKYLEKLPVDHYTFLVHHNENAPANTFRGDGLEHAASTVILFNMPFEEQPIAESVRRIASHEFFHILMPINLHSEEIHNYSFSSPAQSKHLWLYEGMTEYFSIHMPVRNKVQSLADFSDVLKEKIKKMEAFDNSIPLTELSSNAFTRQDQYYNFYLRGALTNLCFDIKLREISKGERGVYWLVKQLIAKYGKEKPFKDENLFNDIYAIVENKEVTDFIRNYIEGSKPLPLKEYFDMVGIEYEEGGKSIRFMEEKKMTTEQKTMQKYWIGY